MRRFIWRATKAVGGAALAATLGVSAYVIADSERRSAFVRAGRILICGVPIVYDYKVRLVRAEATEAAAAATAATATTATAPVVDGAAAARFTSYLASVLSDIRRSLL